MLYCPCLIAIFKILRINFRYIEESREDGPDRSSLFSLVHVPLVPQDLCSVSGLHLHASRFCLSSLPTPKSIFTFSFVFHICHSHFSPICSDPNAWNVILFIAGLCCQLSVSEMTSSTESGRDARLLSKISEESKSKLEKSEEDNSAPNTHRGQLVVLFSYRLVDVKLFRFCSAFIEKLAGLLIKQVILYVCSYFILDVEPFLQGSEVPPVDKGNIVFWIVLLHGIGMLMPWNMFITISDAVGFYRLQISHLTS